MRAFVIAAIASIVSAVLIVLAVEQSWHVSVLILASVLGLASLVLAMAAVISMRRMRVVVHLDDAGYKIVGADRVREGDWADVTRVTETTDGRHITIYHGNVARTHLLCPGGTQEAEFRAMLADIARRLDSTFGYGSGL